MKRLIFSLIAGGLLLGMLSAHPHLFIETKCTLEFDDKGIPGGLWLQFEFDKIFSGNIIQNYDENEDGQFNDAETKLVHDNAFINLENYNFFTFIRHGDEFVRPDRAESFSVRCSETNLLIYDFFIPLASFPYKDYYIAIYDETFFCNVSYKEDGFSVGGSNIPEYRAARENNDDFAVHYNPSGAADDTATYENWALGLLTFIPEEIHVLLP